MYKNVGVAVSHESIHASHSKRPSQIGKSQAQNFRALSVAMPQLPLPILALTEWFAEGGHTAPQASSRFSSLISPRSRAVKLVEVRRTPSISALRDVASMSCAQVAHAAAVLCIKHDALDLLKQVLSAHKLDLSKPVKRWLCWGCALLSENQDSREHGLACDGMCPPEQYLLHVAALAPTPAALSLLRDSCPDVDAAVWGLVSGPVRRGRDYGGFC